MDCARCRDHLGDQWIDTAVVHLLYHVLVDLDHIKELIMSEQSEIDQDVSDIEAAIATVNTGVTGLEAEIAALQAANPSLDLSGLQTAVGDLKTAAGAIPAPTPPPAP